MDGIGCNNPENAITNGNDFDNVDKYADGRMGGNCVYLWMSDYHPDGGQLFFPQTSGNPETNLDKTKSMNEPAFPMFACLGKSTYGDDIRYQI